MTLIGHIQNGVVVLDGPSPPEGTRVIVSLEAEAPPVLLPSPAPRVETTPDGLPIVRGGTPGTLHLTNEQIHEILNEEENEKARRLFLGLPDPANVNSEDSPGVSS